jgi:hypothetical protein
VKGFKFTFLSGKFKPLDGKLRYKLSVFLVCVLLSSMMWGMIKLTHEYDVTVRFNVEAATLPKDRILVGNTDSVISVTVRAKGLDYYSRLLSAQLKPLYFNLNDLKLKRSGDRYTGYLRTSRNTRVILDQLPSGIEILSIEPDTLHFIFEKSFSKKVAIRPDVSLRFSRQYNLYDSIAVTPDSVLVSGRKEILDTLKYITTEHKSYSGLDKNLNEKLRLINPGFYPPLKFSVDSAELKLNVEKFTEAQVDVPVELIFDSPSGSTYKTFPEKLTLTCLIAMKDYNRLDPSLFTVVANTEALKESPDRRIPVKVIAAPLFIKVIKIEPDKVEYLIIK